MVKYTHLMLFLSGLILGGSITLLLCSYAMNATRRVESLKGFSAVKVNRPDNTIQIMANSNCFWGTVDALIAMVILKLFPGRYTVVRSYTRIIIIKIIIISLLLTAIILHMVIYTIF